MSATFRSDARERLLAAGLSRQAFLLLRTVFTVAPILFGLDKFANVLTDRPRYGPLLVAAWLAGIIANLLLIGDYYDVAPRDFGLLVGAVALSRLAVAPDGNGRRTP